VPILSRPAHFARREPVLSHFARISGDGAAGETHPGARMRGAGHKGEAAMKRWMRLAFANWLVLTATMALSAGTASGTMEVNGKVIQLTHAYALLVENWMEKDQNATVLLLSDRPLSDKVLKEKANIFDYRDAGMNGIKMEFYGSGDNYSMNIVGGGVEGSFSSSGTFDASQFTVFEPAKIAGKIAAERDFGQTQFKYDVSFETEVRPRQVKKKATPEEMKSAQNTESAKAYVAFNQAVRDGKLDAIRAGVVPERAEMMDKPEFKDVLAMIQMMMPSEIQVVKATEEGDSAELELIGKDGDKEKEGTASLRNVNGKWLVAGESWR
jgi:hypothetical protein